MLRRKWYRKLAAPWWVWAGLLASGLLAVVADVENWLDPEDAYAAWIVFWVLCASARPVTAAFRLGLWVGSRHPAGVVMHRGQARPAPAGRGERLPPG